MDRRLERGRLLDAMTRRARLLWFLGVLLLVVVVFAPSLDGEFIWDDAYIIVRNANLTAPGGLARMLRTDAWGGAGATATQLYRPVPMLTLWAQAQLTGLSAFAMRAFNLVLHLGCGALLFAWLRRRGISELIAAACTLLFLVHPTNTEPVAWINARHDPLGALFILIALLVWPEGDRPSAWRAALASVACAAAFLSKEAFVVAPALVALVHVAGRPRRHGSLLLVLPFLAIVAVFTLRAALGIKSGSAMTSAGVTTLATHYATITWHYLAQLVSLRADRTTAWYRPLPPASAAIVLATVVAMSLLVLRRARRSELARGIALGWLWFLATLAPLVLAIPLIGMWGNRYAYVPAIGLVVALAHAADATLSTASATVRRVVGGLAAVAIAYCSVSTAGVARTFRSDLALFGADVRAAPDDPRANYHYGTAVYPRGGCEEALPLYQRAVEIDPTYARALRNVAGCALNLQRFDQAIAAATAARRLEPGNPVHPYHLGAALASKGDVTTARTALQDALALDAGYAPARQLLAQLP